MLPRKAPELVEEGGLRGAGFQTILRAPPWESDPGHRTPQRQGKPSNSLPCLHPISRHSGCPEEKNIGVPERMLFFACQSHSAACPLCPINYSVYAPIWIV